MRAAVDCGRVRVSYNPLTARSNHDGRSRIGFGFTGSGIAQMMMNLQDRTRVRLEGLLVPLILVAVVGGAVRAQEESAAALPLYPRVNVSTTYQVAPGWPSKPDSCVWGPMSGIAIDAHDQVYVFTRAQPPVQVYDRDGRFVRSWGGEHIGKAHHIKFDPSGNVWLADIGHHTVMKFNTEGKLLLTLGTPDEPGRDAGHFNQPTDMVVTPRGDIFVTDGYGNNRVVHFDQDGRFIKEWGRLGTEPGEFSLPHAIALDSKGRLYVADRNNVRIQVFDQDGKLLDVWNDRVVPWGLWMTQRDELWVCGSSPMAWRNTDVVLGVPPRDQVFMKFDTAGTIRQIWSVPKGADGHERPGECNWVHCVAVDSHGNLYAGDILGKRAQKFTRLVAGSKMAANRLIDPLIQRAGRFFAQPRFQQPVKPSP